MPDFYNIAVEQVYLSHALRRLRATPLRTKQPRRNAQSYADRLLERAAAKVAVQKAQARR